MIITAKISSAKVSKAILTLSSAAGVGVDLIVRKTAVNVLHKFQVAAPVDTGRFRAGWSPFLIHNGGANLVEGPNSKAVSEGRSRGSFSMESRRFFPKLTVSNGVRYGGDLEGGRSSQATAGFHQRILDAEAGHMSGGGP